MLRRDFLNDSCPLNSNLDEKLSHPYYVSSRSFIKQSKLNLCACILKECYEEKYFPITCLLLQYTVKPAWAIMYHLGATGFRVRLLQAALAKQPCSLNYNISKVFHKHLVMISIMGFANCYRYMFLVNNPHQSMPAQSRSFQLLRGKHADGKKGSCNNYP